MDLHELRRFADDLKDESDRAAVILGAAKLDLLLFQLLSKVLKPHTGKTDELLEGDAPLGTFSARSMMAFRLGLIDDEMYRAINLVRRIRNSFAHELSGISLQSGSHCDRVRDLIAPMRQHLSYQWISKDIDPEASGAAHEFHVAIGLMAVRLSAAVTHMDKVCTDSPMTLIPPEWDEQLNKDQDKDIAEGRGRLKKSKK